MNDAAYTFNQTNRERSVTARGAWHKRGGSRSKKCTLPSDNLTPAQKKGLNGTVETYSMNAPHTLEELKLWPEDLRHEYMKGLLERHSPSNEDLALMLGCSRENIARALSMHFGIRRRKGGNRVRTVEMERDWIEFVGRDIPDDEELPPLPPIPDPEMEADEPEVAPATGIKQLILDKIEIRFTGTVQDLVNMVQTGVLRPAAGIAYTFSLCAERTTP